MNRGSQEEPAETAILIAPASMRPRFMNRGSPDSTRDHPATHMRFNEAPIHESGKSSPSSPASSI